MIIAENENAVINVYVFTGIISYQISVENRRLLFKTRKISASGRLSLHGKCMEKTRAQLWGLRA